MRRLFCSAFLAGLVCLAITRCGNSAIEGVQQLAVGHTLSFPAFAMHAPGDRNRLFVAELGGNIKILDLNNPNAAPAQFLNIPDTDPAGEGGLLGLAFHPNYFGTAGPIGQGKFYVYVTVDNGGINIGGAVSPFSTHIREYTVMGNPMTSNVADPTSMKEILQFVQPQANHNAGWIGFNPAITPGQPQYLYIASGDGGGGNDDGAGHTSGTGNAQDLSNNLLGKILRIDVNEDAFTGASDPQNIRNYAIPPTNPFVSGPGDPMNNKDDEILAYGLRNPFRNSFDRATGDLWIGDVGQGQREEIDFLPASSGGQNYGWRLREGNIQTPGVGGPAPPDYVAPIYDYTRGSGALQGETVIGGYRYRGPDPDLQGLYFFADANDDNVWLMTPPNPVAPNTAVVNIDSLLNNLSGIDRIVSFGEDAIGRLYLVDLNGEVYRILTTPTAGDFNSDNTVNFLDIDLLAEAARNNSEDPIYDLNGDNMVTFEPSSSGVVSDSDELVRVILVTDYGDTDLDDDIDTVDITRAISNFTGAGNIGKSWETGDIDGDSDTDTVDITTVISNFTGAGGGAATAAGLAADPVPPTLVYDARTGEVVVNPGDETILSFSLAGDGLFSASAADFGELDESVLAGLSSSLVDNTSDQVGWVSVAATAGLGLDSAETIGTVLPAGLSTDKLSAILRNSWAGTRGAGGTFQLLVIPEPNGLLLAVFAVIFRNNLWHRRPKSAIVLGRGSHR
jgi:glucose/arabinose dehydrogenase